MPRFFHASGSGRFPHTRLRRMRRLFWSRNWMREHHLHTDNLILPVFVHEGKHDEDIPLMPSVKRLCLESLVATAQSAYDVGIHSLMLFPVVPPDAKDEKGSEALNPDNLLCRAIQALRQSVPSMGIICDVALDPYTSHGHDGILKDDDVDNDATVALLAQQALVQAKAGCDVVAPSDMMDGRVGVLRKTLDENGFQHVLILAYSAKYASHLYHPFRHAIGSHKTLKGAKTTYQMDTANLREALREALQDIDEGADMLMVKPGTLYLDVIHALRTHTLAPLAAYHVSGEYAMLRAAAEKGCLIYEDVLLETLLSFRRAGADVIITYGALDAARLLSR
ncbi:MAG: porphobilinogen synthase [Alphaproteobacteria bacterium GM202ARS2]|nr:porphobilinogen synthase [Alphaproteobacteria bacterium GM202ARS2]